MQPGDVAGEWGKRGEIKHKKKKNNTLSNSIFTLPSALGIHIKQFAFRSAAVIVTPYVEISNSPGTVGGYGSAWFIWIKVHGSSFFKLFLIVFLRGANKEFLLMKKFLHLLLLHTCIFKFVQFYATLFDVKNNYALQAEFLFCQWEESQWLYVGLRANWVLTMRERKKIYIKN